MTTGQRVMRERMPHRAEQKPGEAAAPARTDDDHVGAFGGVEERNGRFSSDDAPLHLDPVAGDPDSASSSTRSALSATERSSFGSAPTET